jgi:hypothetical protein
MDYHNTRKRTESYEIQNDSNSDGTVLLGDLDYLLSAHPNHVVI